MSLNSTNFRAQHTANGTATVFSFPYLFLDETHLVVVDTDPATGTETTKTLTTDYTVSGEGNYTGGSVTFLTPPTNTHVITISRIVPITQLVDYNQSDPFPADTTEQALDKLTMICQQLSEAGGSSDRSLRYPSTEPDGYTAELPAAASRADTVLTFDASGDLELVAKDSFPQGPAGEGVPSGGTAGQILEKIDGTDYNTQWADKPTTTGAITSSDFTMATARLLGRTTASTGDIEEISVGSGLTLSGGVLDTASSGGGAVVQVKRVEYSTNTTTTNAIPWDNTKPQNTEGTELLTATITPSSASNKILILIDGYVRSTNSARATIFALFRDSGADAISATPAGYGNVLDDFNLTCYDSPATTSEITYSLRFGPTNGDTTSEVNDPGDILGNTKLISITLLEVTP